MHADGCKRCSASNWFQKLHFAILMPCQLSNSALPLPGPNAAKCKLKFTVLQETRSGGHKCNVLAVVFSEAAGYLISDDEVGGASAMQRPPPPPPAHYDVHAPRQHQASPGCYAAAAAAALLLTYQLLLTYRADQVLRRSMYFSLRCCMAEGLSQQTNHRLLLRRKRSSPPWQWWRRHRAAAKYAAHNDRKGIAV